MSGWLRKVEAVRRMGWGWGLWRAGYELRRRTGWLKRQFPTPVWSEVSLHSLLRDGVPPEPEAYRAYREQSSGTFLFGLGKLPSREVLERIAGASGVRRAVQVADDFCTGKFLYFSRHVFDLGTPVDWRRNPFLNRRLASDAHWCDWTAFSPEQGDIKDVWEPSRFSCAFWLVRAYAMTGDEKYPQAFWRLFESWCEQNSPNRGPNWRCGQETAFRIMAWCFALWGFWKSPVTTPQRVAAMVAALAVSAARIEPNIDYAVSQKNNHAISEALGLFTVGALFPELRDATRWQRSGRRILEREVLRQTYADGSYVQQSMNYHRVMLHDCLWAWRLAELNGMPLSSDVRARVAAAAEFLFEMLDESSGSVPNYGANDGALVLPLSSGGYRDYRDTIGAAMFIATGKRVLPAGPWDEAILWLCGAGAVENTPAVRHPAARRFDVGGYYTLRTGRTWAMIRCHRYLDRPGHVDMLHLDLWHDGVNVLRDCGTYRYYAPREPGMEKYFKDIAAHNTVQVGEGGPLELVSRFIWLPWPGARCTRHSADSFVGEHDAYARPPWNVMHRRSVDASDPRKWIVTDDLIGGGEQSLILRWHLVDGPHELESTGHRVILRAACGRVRIAIEGPSGTALRVKRGVERDGEIAGWASEYYGERAPAPVLEATCRAVLPTRFVTTIELPDAGEAPA
ncbi:MAG: hypothetical protein HBSAPP02_18890 [Phycisphaerae bacterium]|nr:MAG: alginate lyase family protein [Planctomycetia bacterium]GJQ26857.1 MAG: hypothetical protein HBSAPP02_18890 [Phycisphaerae bacterium]